MAACAPVCAFMTEIGDLVQLALRLRASSREDGAIDAVQVRLIGLDDIRAAAGDQWPRMRERVRLGSSRLLSRFLGPEDVIVPAGDGFLVILAEGARNTQERCAKMREALLSFYLGEDSLSGLTPDVTARTLSADGFADLMSAAMHEDAPTRAQAKRADIAEARIFSIGERRVVARWFCPVLSEPTGRRLAYDREFIFDGALRRRDFLDLDLAILERAQASASGKGRALAIGFSVHSSTLHTRRSRGAFIEALTQASPEFRRRSIATIAEIEKGTPLIAISEWSSDLRAQLGRVFLDFHYSDHAIGSVASTGAWAAGFHLPIYSGAQKGPRAARTLEQIRFWSKALHRQGMRLAVNGFYDAEFVEAAREAGANFATSDVLWPFVGAVEESADVAAADASRRGGRPNDYLAAP